MPVTLDDVVDLLREQNALVRESNAILLKLVAARQGSSNDLTLKILNAVVAVTAGKPVTMRQLWALSEINTAPALALRVALSATTPLRLGRELGRLKRGGVDGFVINTLGRGRTGEKWRIQCRDDAGPSTPAFAGARRISFNAAHGQRKPRKF